MPYQSPNIVLVGENASAINNKKGQLAHNTPSDRASLTISANVTNQHTPNMSPKVTPASQEAAKQNVLSENINVSKENVEIASLADTSKSTVTESDTNKNASTSNSNVKKPDVSWASNYLQSIGKPPNAKPVKVRLSSTSNDEIKRAVNSADEIKRNQSIKINLLSRPKEVSKTAETPGLPPSQTPNFNSGVRPCMDTWNCPSQLATSINQNIVCTHTSPFVTTTWSCPPLLQTPTNLSIDSRLCMSTTCTCSCLSQTPTNLSMECRPLWTLPPLLETTNQNIESRYCMNTTLTCPSQFHTPTHLNIGSSPYMDPTLTCPPQLATHSSLNTGFRPRIDTKTWLTQESCTNYTHLPNENINPTTSSVSEQDTTYTQITPQDTQSSGMRSRLDYTWLTRAHYENINQTKNTEKQIGRTLPNTLATKPIKPTLVSSRDNKLPCPTINNIKFKNGPKEELLKSEKHGKKLTPIKSNAALDKCTNKEMIEKRKLNIKKAIKTLETKIKNLTAQTPFKIPKLSNSNQDFVEHPQPKKETHSQIQHTKKIILDKSEKDETQNSKNPSPNQKQTYKKRVCHNSKNNDSLSKIRKLTHSSYTGQSSIHRKLNTENRNHSESKKVIHANKIDQRAQNRVDIDSIYKYKNRSDRVEPHCAKILQTKRIRRDSSCESVPKKRFCYELKNIDNVEKNSPNKSLITPTKSQVKHPRIQAPESADSDDDFESEFDLRSKLRKKSYKRYKITREAQLEQSVNSQKGTPRKNLVIPGNRNNDDKNAASSKPGPSNSQKNPKQKSKKYKKIRLVINVIQEDTSEDSSSDASKDTIESSTDVTNESSKKQTLDLSFLDDFNIDEIVNSLKQSPKLDNIQQHITQNVENTKTTTESVTNFVRPIIIKNEINVEHIHLDNNNTQSAVEYSQDRTLDNVTNPESLKNNLNKQTSENTYNEMNEITNEVSAHNIKQEIHEDQTETIKVDNLNTDMAHLQTPLDANVSHTVKQITAAVAVNTQVVIETPSVVEIIRDVKREPDENHNDFEQIYVRQDLYVANKQCKLEKADTYVSPDLTEKESSLEKSYEFSGTSENIFVEANQDKSVNTDYDDVQHNNNEMISGGGGNTKHMNMIEASQPEAKEISLPEEPVTNSLDKYVTIENNCEVKIIAEVETKTTNKNHVNKIETKQPNVQETNTENKLATATFTSGVAIADGYEIIINDNVVTDIKNVDIADPIQSKIEDKSIQYILERNSLALPNVTIEEKAFEDKLETNTSAISSVLIENNHEVEVSNTVVSVYNIDDSTVTIKQKIEEKAPGNEPKTNTIVKSGVTAKDNKKLTGNKDAPNNKSAITRTVTKLHPSIKKYKDLAVKIEKKVLDYVKLKLNVTSFIHNGKFARVFLCQDTNGQKYALKILKDESVCHTVGFEKEKMWNKLQHEIPKENLNIVYLINGFSLDRNWCFLTEFYPMNLRQALQRTQFNMDTVQHLAKQLVSAVLMIRSNNIVHSDIKPVHILLNSTYDSLKVCGFDEAYYADDTKEVLPNIGTMNYRAPEIILGHSAGFSIDVWATGLVIFEMAAGVRLFDNNYNSNMLFDQMSLCGQLPLGMMLHSRLSHRHFHGAMFKRIVGPCGQYILYTLNKFRAKTKMFSILTNVCSQRWSKFRDQSTQAKDKAMLVQMSNLLDKMLVIDPRKRITIELAYAFFMYKV